MINKELLLLRHGKSDWKSDTTDFYRPLNKRGKANARRMGEWLNEQSLLPDLIISSPAKRALSTAKRVSAITRLDKHCIQQEVELYEADLSALMQVLSTVPESVQRLLLVGHNPSLEDLLCHLVAGIPIPIDGKLMPTASLAYLQLDTYWSSLQGQYWVQRVKDLP